MKPLFDSEEFVFIGDADHSQQVRSRKCECEAHVELRARPQLRARCPKCGMERSFPVKHAPVVDGLGGPRQPSGNP